VLGKSFSTPGDDLHTQVECSGKGDPGTALHYSMPRDHGASPEQVIRLAGDRTETGLNTEHTPQTFSQDV